MEIFNPLESKVPVRVGLEPGGTTVAMDQQCSCSGHGYVRACSQVLPVHWGPWSWQEEVFHQYVWKDKEEKQKPVKRGWQLAIP